MTSSSSSLSTESTSSPSSSSTSSVSSSSGWGGYDPDPYTQLYRAIRDAILDDDDIIALGVKVRNTPNLTDTANKQPLKSNAQNADFPELLLFPITTDYRLCNTNTGHQIVKRFAIRFADNQQVLHAKFQPVQWALTACFARLLRTNKTLGLAFVRKLMITDDRAAYGDNLDATRGTPGWVGLMNVEVLLAFTDDNFDIHSGT